MPAVSTAAVALAFALDVAFGEWPESVHPVAWYGSVIGWLDRDGRSPRLIGVAGAVVLPLVAAVVVALATALGSRLHPAIGGVVAGGVLFTSMSWRRLLTAARAVVSRSETDLPAARQRLPTLVGRDPTELSAGEVRSAAVESAAENLADGLVAPLVAFVLLSWSLPLAAAGAAWVKAVNTGDSMLGYRSKPIGWAFARLDDLVMWFPARLTAGLIAVTALDPQAVVRARRWARTPASPNAGWPMATIGAVLDCRLEKPGAYTLWPAGTLPTADEAQRGIRIVGRAGLLAVGTAGVIAWP